MAFTERELYGYMVRVKQSRTKLLWSARATSGRAFLVVVFFPDDEDYWSVNREDKAAGPRWNADGNRICPRNHLMACERLPRGFDTIVERSPWRYSKSMTVCHTCAEQDV